MFSKSPPRSVRGEMIRSRIEFIKNEHLDWKKILERLPDDARIALENIRSGTAVNEAFPTPDHLTRQLPATAWFPVAILNGFMEAATAVLDEMGITAVTANRAAGRIAARIHFNSMLSFILHWGSPQLALNIMHKAWEHLISGGGMHIVKNEHGYAELMMQCDFLSPLFQHTTHGLIEEYLTMKGIKEFEVQSAYSSAKNIYYFKVKWAPV